MTRNMYAVILVAMAISGIASTCASASPPPVATAAALENLSSSRPCTAAALLYISIKADAASSGVFYLPGIPTPNEIGRLIRLPDVGAEDFPLQTSLYGETSYYTEIRWVLESLNERVTLVSAEGQLVNAAGVKLDPSHVVEPLTRVLLTGKHLRVLPPGEY